MKVGSIVVAVTMSPDTSAQTPVSERLYVSHVHHVVGVR